MLRLVIAALTFILVYVPAGFAEPPTKPASSFSKAKQLARDKVYFDRQITFYCRCFYDKKGHSGGVIDPSDCGFQSTKNNIRTRRLEWEHVVPASVLAGDRACWKTGHPSCTKRGRDCCEKAGVDEDARRMIFDLHNLVPSIGEVNADRSNFHYGIIDGEARAYGVCDFEVDKTRKVAEPRPSLRGNVARIWFYMSDTYGMPLSAQQRQMFDNWSEADPVGDWEIERDARIELVQGNRNPHVEP